MGNTLFFALITIVPSMVVGLFLATLVNRKSRLIGFVRTSYFYPVVMPMIAIASIWMFIYMAKNGLLDQMLISMGLQPMNILSSKKTVLPAMAFMSVPTHPSAFHPVIRKSFQQWNALTDCSFLRK